MGIPESVANAGDAGPADRLAADGAPTATVRARRRRTTLALFDQAAVSGANFLVAALVGRCCGVEELGLYALGVSLSVLTVVVHEGLILTPYAIRLGGLGPGESRELAGHALSMSVGFAAVSSVGFAVLGLTSAGWRADVDLSPVFFALCLASPFMLWRDLARRMELARLRVHAALLVDATAAVVSLGLVAALIALGRLDAGGAILAIGAGCGVAAALWFAFTGRDIEVRRQGLRRGVLRSLRLGGWITAARLTNVAGHQTVPWLLAIQSGTVATGGFAAANTIVSVSNPILMGLGSIYLPETVNDYARGGVEALRGAGRRITRTMCATAAAFALVVALTAEPILGLIYGSEFERFSSVAIVLAAAALFSVLGFGAETGLRILEKPRIDFFASVLMLLSTSVTTIALTERCGAAAGAVGLLIGSATATLARRVAFARLCPGVARRGATPREPGS